MSALSDFINANYGGTEQEKKALENKVLYGADKAFFQRNPQFLAPAQESMSTALKFGAGFDRGVMDAVKGIAELTGQEGLAQKAAKAYEAFNAPQFQPTAPKDEGLFETGKYLAKSLGYGTAEMLGNIPAFAASMAVGGTALNAAKLGIGAIEGLAAANAIKTSSTLATVAKTAFEGAITGAAGNVAYDITRNLYTAGEQTPLGTSAVLGAGLGGVLGGLGGAIGKYLEKPAVVETPKAEVVPQVETQTLLKNATPEAKSYINDLQSKGIELDEPTLRKIAQENQISEQPMGAKPAKDVLGARLQDELIATNREHLDTEIPKIKEALKPDEIVKEPTTKQLLSNTTKEGLDYIQSLKDKGAELDNAAIRKIAKEYQISEATTKPTKNLLAERLQRELMDENQIHLDEEIPKIKEALDGMKTQADYELANIRQSLLKEGEATPLTIEQIVGSKASLLQKLGVDKAEALRVATTFDDQRFGKVLEAIKRPESRMAKAIEGEAQILAERKATQERLNKAIAAQKQSLANAEKRNLINATNEKFGVIERGYITPEELGSNALVLGRLKEKLIDGKKLSLQEQAILQKMDETIKPEHIEAYRQQADTELKAQTEIMKQIDSQPLTKNAKNIMDDGVIICK